MNAKTLKTLTELTKAFESKFDNVDIENLESGVWSFQCHYKVGRTRFDSVLEDIQALQIPNEFSINNISEVIIGKSYLEFKVFV